MAATRIQVVVSAREREAMRSAAAKEGSSLSAFLRRAGRDRMEAANARPHWGAADLSRFFNARRKAERGTEPDWEAHLRVMAASRAGGTVES